MSDTAPGIYELNLCATCNQMTNWQEGSCLECSPRTDEELRNAILANLKHAYFNAKADTVALQNGVIPNQNHALGILNNKADDLMLLVSQYGDRREREGIIEAEEAALRYALQIVEDTPKEFAIEHFEHRILEVSRGNALFALKDAKTHIDRGPGFTHHDQDSCGV